MVIVMEKPIEESDRDGRGGSSTRLRRHRSTVPINPSRRRRRCRVSDPREFELFDGVQEVVRVSEPYKLSSRTFKRETTVVQINGCKIGGKDVIVMAGPCTIENEKQLFETARAVARAGAKVLRGGAYKPRTSPYAFQGMGVEGLKLLQAAGKEFGMATVSEVMEIPDRDVGYWILQIGARNMQNYNCSQLRQGEACPSQARHVGQIQEWLAGSDYVMSGGTTRSSSASAESYIRTIAEPLDSRRSRSCRSLASPIIAEPSHAKATRQSEPLAAPASRPGGWVALEVHIETEKRCATDRSRSSEQFWS